MKQIFLDMDGVIVDFTQGLIDFYDLDATEESFKSWGSIYGVCGREHEELWNDLGYRFWVGLKFTKEAKVILKMLKRYQPILLSLPPINQPLAYAAKARWVEDNLPEFHKSGRILLGGTKYQIAGPDKLLIDDHEEYCNSWIAHGGSAILVPRPWNMNRGLSVYNEIRHGLEIFTGEYL